MYTMTGVLALVLSLGTLKPLPTWNRDYRLALKEAEAAKKPVAVFIGRGTDGWKAAYEEGEMRPPVRQLLADRYVCVYVDADRPAEQALVRSFAADQLPLVVLSSHSRAYQAYRHSGKLTNASLAGALQSHAAEDFLEETALRYVSDSSFGLGYYATACRT